MNHRTLGVIGVRLLAVWMIAMGITFLPNLVSVWLWGDQLGKQTINPGAAVNWLRFTYMAAVVDRLLIGFLLWVVSAWLSRRMFPANVPSSPEASSSLLVRGAIGITGLVIAVTAIPTLITSAITTPGIASTVGYPSAAPSWAYLGVRVVLVSLGLVLIFGARALHELIFRSRIASA